MRIDELISRTPAEILPRFGYVSHPEDHEKWVGGEGDIYEIEGGDIVHRSPSLEELWRVANSTLGVVKLRWRLSRMSGRARANDLRSMVGKRPIDEVVGPAGLEPATRPL